MVGMDGISATRAIAGRAPEVSVVLLTSSRGCRAGMIGLRAGANGHLVKGPPVRGSRGRRADRGRGRPGAGAGGGAAGDRAPARPARRRPRRAPRAQHADLARVGGARPAVRRALRSTTSPIASSWRATPCAPTSSASCASSACTRRQRRSRWPTASARPTRRATASLSHDRSSSATDRARNRADVALFERCHRDPASCPSSAPGRRSCRPRPSPRRWPTWPTRSSSTRASTTTWRCPRPTSSRRASRSRDHNLGVGSRPRDEQLAIGQERLAESSTSSAPTPSSSAATPTRRSRAPAPRSPPASARARRGGAALLPRRHARGAQPHRDRPALRPAPGADARRPRHLIAEGVAGRVEVTGDPLCDTLERSRADIAPAEGEYLLATVHRNYNTDAPERLQLVLDCLARSPWRVIFPVHPRTRKRARHVEADGAGQHRSRRPRRPTRACSRSSVARR